MIFYFTGTGNSLWVAKALSEALGEPLISIADELRKEEEGLAYPVRPDEKILFVYPCIPGDRRFLLPALSPVWL